MQQRWVTGVAIAASFAMARPAAATPVTSFDTVDAVEVIDTISFGQQLKITGIVTGASAPTTVQFIFSSGQRLETATRCERMATIALAKPGKFRLVITDSTAGAGSTGCKLTAVTP